MQPIWLQLQGPHTGHGEDPIPWPHWLCMPSLHWEMVPAAQGLWSHQVALTSADAIMAWLRPFSNIMWRLGWALPGGMPALLSRFCCLPTFVTKHGPVEICQEPRDANVYAALFFMADISLCLCWKTELCLSFEDQVHTHGSWLLGCSPNH